MKQQMMGRYADVSASNLTTVSRNNSQFTRLSEVESSRVGRCELAITRSVVTSA